MDKQLYLVGRIGGELCFVQEENKIATLLKAEGQRDSMGNLCNYFIYTFPQLKRITSAKIKLIEKGDDDG